MFLKISYPFFAILSTLAPRDKSIWVFGHYNGYNENTRYFFEHASSKNEFTCYWLANTQREMQEVSDHGYNSILKKSVKGYWYSSRAYLTFICTGYSDVNRILALRSNVIHFWHGTPIKKVFFDQKHQGISAPFRYHLSKFLVSRIKLYYASSQFEKDLVAKAAHLSKDKAVALGSPRYDYIRNHHHGETLHSFKKIYDEIILFAPTWRQNNNWDEGFYLSPEDKYKLECYLESRNSLLLIKQHPKTDSKHIKLWGLDNSERIVFTEDLGLKDINTMYKHIDILITDVSSVLFDFLIFDKPILIFMPDLNEYIRSERGVYDYFKDFLTENSIKSWGDLINSLAKNHSKPKFLKDLAIDVQSYINTNHSIYNHLISFVYEKSDIVNPQ